MVHAQNWDKTVFEFDKNNFEYIQKNKFSDGLYLSYYDLLNEVNGIQPLFYFNKIVDTTLVDEKIALFEINQEFLPYEEIEKYFYVVKNGIFYFQFFRDPKQKRIVYIAVSKDEPYQYICSAIPVKIFKKLSKKPLNENSNEQFFESTYTIDSASNQKPFSNLRSAKNDYYLDYYNFLKNKCQIRFDQWSNQFVDSKNEVWISGNFIISLSLGKIFDASYLTSGYILSQTPKNARKVDLKGMITVDNNLKYYQFEYKRSNMNKLINLLNQELYQP
jgi:hypothetical protein